MKLLAPGSRVRAFGEMRSGFFGARDGPSALSRVRGEAPLPAALTPIYPTTAGLSQADLRRAIEPRSAAADLDDTLPQRCSCAAAGLAAFATPSSCCTIRRRAPTATTRSRGRIPHGGA